MLYGGYRVIAEEFRGDNEVKVYIGSLSIHQYIGMGLGGLGLILASVGCVKKDR